MTEGSLIDTPCIRFDCKNYVVDAIFKVACVECVHFLRQSEVRKKKDNFGFRDDH